MFAHAYWWKDYSEDYSKMYIVTISWLLIFMLEKQHLWFKYILLRQASHLSKNLWSSILEWMASKEIQPNLQNGQLELCDCQVNNGLLVSL